MSAPAATVRVPASSANLGPGFDALGVALSLHATVGCGDPPPDVALDPASGPARAVPADEHHPASVAFAAAGGHGPLWVHAPIPMGRGLGYSGAVRVAGALAAITQRAPSLVGRAPAEVRDDLVEIAGRLEGHVDNVAASVHGGVVVAAGGRVVPVPLAVAPVILVWVPDDVTTSTDRSRAALPGSVPFADAVFNAGRTALLIAALASGDVDALAIATQDRLHQEARLRTVPGSAAALDAGRAAGAWCGWLSGSGPSVALMCDPATVDEVAGALPAGGHVKHLAIETEGATVLVPGSTGEVELGR